MFIPIAGMVVLGVAIGLSRDRRGGLGATGIGSMGVHTSEALAAVQRAASRLYGTVDVPRDDPNDIMWSDPDYQPACSVYTEDAKQALLQAHEAEDAGEPGAYFAKIAAVQAWSLSQIECESDGNMQTLAERPVVPR